MSRFRSYSLSTIVDLDFTVNLPVVDLDSIICLHIANLYISLHIIDLDLKYVGGLSYHKEKIVSKHDADISGKRNMNKVMDQVSIESGSGSGSGSYSGGLTWSIVLKCDDHTGIFTCDGCARDPYFYVPAETQSYVIKLSCSRKVLAASGD